MTGDILAGININSGDIFSVIILFRYNTVDRFRCF